jgi:hypothetical protein
MTRTKQIYTPGGPVSNKYFEFEFEFECEFEFPNIFMGHGKNPSFVTA